MIAHTQAHLSRQQAIQWAKEIVSGGNAVIIDTETSGLGDDAEIVDIGVVGIDGTVYLDCLVKPTRPIPPGATAVHGITDEMVADADRFPVVYQRLREALTTDQIVVYNLAYDLKVINANCRANDLPEFHMSSGWDCAMLAFSEYDGTVGKYGSLKWHKLDFAAKTFGIEPGGHRALADADTTRKVILAMAEAPY